MQNDQYEQGAVLTTTGNPIFSANRKLFIKEYSSLQVNSLAVTVLKNGEDNVMAIAKYGKGTVFAFGDPWIYNEYLDGRRLTPGFDNYQAAEEWVKWLIKQTK